MYLFRIRFDAPDDKVHVDVQSKSKYVRIAHFIFL